MQRGTQRVPARRRAQRGSDSRPLFKSGAHALRARG
jgi:hypothetical protein